MNFFRPIKMVLFACLLAPAAFAQAPLPETRATLEKWIETRGLISKTRNDWQVDKESLQQTIALYERELQSIDAQMLKVSTNNNQVMKEMAEAEDSKRTSTEAIEQARRFALEFEVKIRKVLPLLPSPLQDLVKKEVSRMPANPEDTKMLAAERIQVCVAILNEIDKFNNAVSIFNEKRKNEKGDEVSVETVYVGLGAAYFVNEANDFSGIGVPGAEGWTWTPKPGLAPAVRQAIKIYRNEHSPAFVRLPVAVN